MPFPGMDLVDDDGSLADLTDLLADLCSRQLAETPDTEYLRQHAAPGWIADHVRTFAWYRPFLDGCSVLLDWGCQHGPDTVLIHETRPDIELHACDVVDADAYRVFREHTGVRYLPLDGPVRLPYDDGRFDVVVASGVLEHVPSDWQSLAELFRVLRPGGRLIVSYLPNALSLTELRHRRGPGGPGGHERLYSRRGIRSALLHHGFRPLTPILYQTFAWQRQTRAVLGAGPVADRAAAVLRTVAPVHVVRAGTLCFVAERATSM